MIDRQALFDKFLDSLETSPPLQEYLDGEPESPSSFDPYQMVAEWIALRHEVKQQGKLLQSSQLMLQQALDALQRDQDQGQQQEIDQKQGGALVDQRMLWQDLLTVMDALDQACAHWQEQIEALTASPLQQSSQPGSQPFWQRWFSHLIPSRSSDTAPTLALSLREVLISNQQGVELIRRSFLDVLRQRQIVPIIAQGQAFNPQTMYAVGRQETLQAPENTVIQEVVRGYLWGEQILREAQVIVAVEPDRRNDG